MDNCSTCRLIEAAPHKNWSEADGLTKIQDEREPIGSKISSWECDDCGRGWQRTERTAGDRAVSWKAK